MSWKKVLGRFEAVIFDLDGTLIDSMNMWHSIDEEYFELCGKVLPEDYQRCIEGMSIHETAVYTKERFGIDHSIEEMMDIWNDMAFDYYSKRITLKPYAYDFLKYLKSKGIKTGIATSNSEKLCMGLIEGQHLQELFDVILTGDKVKVGKPAPDVYLAVAKQLGVDPKRCLVFEDLCNGIKAGNNAGMTTVAVWDDFSGNVWEIKTSEADYSLMSYEEIMNEVY